MALSWVVSNNKDVRENFAKLSAQDTFLVQGFYPDFVRTILDFFNNTPKVKDFQYVINWNLDGGLRSVQKQGSLDPNATGASAGRSAHNYGMAIDFAPVGLQNGTRTVRYKPVQIGRPYTAHPGVLPEPWAVVVEALYNHPTLLSGATFTKLNDYNHIEWRAYRAYARERAPQYWSGAPVQPGEISTGPSADRQQPSAPTPQGTVSPYITNQQSFHPNIQYELTRRRLTTETANTYMPFVKLTSLTNVLGKNINGISSQYLDQAAAWCPSLGVHGQNTIIYEDIYSPTNAQSIIGYATARVSESPTGYAIVPVVVENGSFSGTLENPVNEPLGIPMPGITEMNLERGTAGPMGVRGGLMRANLKIRAYSVGQVDALLRYFLRPATRVVLEMGRQSSNKNEPFSPFNWKQNRDTLRDVFKDLLLDPDKQTPFLEEYVYNNNGNYEIFLGYVVKFGLKVNKDNVYDIDLTIYSPQQYEIPTTHTGVKSLCAGAADKCTAVDCREYFAKEYSWKSNSFTKLMETVTTQPEWVQHVIPITAPGDTESDAETEYYVSWEFFVQKLINDERLGIAGLISDGVTRRFIKTGLLQPVKTPTEVEITAGTAQESLVANEVGYHFDLRSTDANVMVIYNKTAQDSRTAADIAAFNSAVTIAISSSVAQTGDAEPADVQQRQTEYTSNTTIRDAIVNSSAVGTFRDINANADNTRASAGLLTHGIWIHTAAIKESFTQADTITTAIDSLLTKMNGATEGYWNLQLYSSERPSTGQFIIDMALAKKPAPNLVTSEGDLSIDSEAQASSTDDTSGLFNDVQQIKPERYKASATGNKPKYMYMFNRGSKFLRGGEVGSDILDLNVEFNLPQVIAVQAIAGVGGPAQKSTLQSLDIPELNRISLIGELFPSCPEQPGCAEQLCGPSGPEAAALEQARAETDAARRTADGAKVQAAIRVEAAAVENYNKMVKLQNTYENPAITIGNIQGLTQLGKVLEYIEFNPSAMLKRLNIDSTNAEEGRPTPYAHSFNSSNLTKTTVSVTLPGIGGIELFQSFLVDRVPSILDRGFYIVTKVTHKFSVDRGWTTTIEGRFRFRPTNEQTSSGTYKEPCVSPGLPIAYARRFEFGPEEARQVISGLSSFADNIENLPFIGWLFRDPPARPPR